MTPPPPTQTLPARTVFHEAQAALRPLLTGVQTQEQLEGLLDKIGAIQYVLSPNSDVASSHLYC